MNCVQFSWVARLVRLLRSGRHNENKTIRRPSKTAHCDNKTPERLLGFSPTSATNKRVATSASKIHERRFEWSSSLTVSGANWRALVQRACKLAFHAGSARAVVTARRRNSLSLASAPVYGKWGELRATRSRRLLNQSVPNSSSGGLVAANCLARGPFDLATPSPRAAGVL